MGVHLKLLGPMVLVVGGQESQDQGRKRDPTLRNRQVGTLRLFIDRITSLESAVLVWNLFDL